MKTINVKQGSDEWLAIRGKYRAASEAPVVMGCSHITRDELLRLKSTGDEREFSDYVRRFVLDRGHEIEALARPLAEAFLGEELYPVTGVCDDDYLLASFDGLTMAEDIVWECKSWNENKAADVRAGRVPRSDFWQVVQQLAVSGAVRALYQVTDGTEERSLFVTLEASDVAAEIDTLYAAWRQFDEDLAAYVPREVKPEVVGRAPGDLPALRIEVQGMVTASNLDAFRDHALAVFDGINTQLDTDEDFADAESTVKWCGEVESKLEAAKEQALAQTADIDALFRTIDDIREEARRKRLELDKLVKARKQSIRAEILEGGKRGLAEHMKALNAELADDGVSVPMPAADFAAAMKGKRTVSSLLAARDQVLADARIEASATAERMHANLDALQGFAEHRTLFPDLSSLVLKEPGDFLANVKLRVAEHEEAQRKAAEARAAAEEERERRAAAERQQALLDEASKVIGESYGQASSPNAEKAPEPVEVPAARRPAKDPARRGASEKPTYAVMVMVIAREYSVDCAVADRWIREALAEKEAA